METNKSLELANNHISKNEMGAFASPEVFEQYQRMAKALSASSIVPMAYRAVGKNNTMNPEALPNCIVALDIANRLNTSPFLVMQNMDVIEGRPSWKSSYLISVVNTHPRFKGYLEFDFINLGMKKVNTEVWKGEYPNAKKETVVTEVENIGCTAWIMDNNGKKLESMMITCEIAILEGWWNRKGSKWPTMTKQMLSYRAASLFNRMYCPETGLGMHTREEVEDFTAIENSELKLVKEPASVSSLNNIVAENAVVESETKTADTPKKGSSKSLKDLSNSATLPVVVVESDNGPVVNPGLPIEFSEPKQESEPLPETSASTPSVSSDDLL